MSRGALAESMDHRECSFYLDIGSCSSRLCCSSVLIGVYVILNLIHNGMISLCIFLLVHMLTRDRINSYDGAGTWMYQLWWMATPWSQPRILPTRSAITNTGSLMEGEQATSPDFWVKQPPGWTSGFTNHDFTIYGVSLANELRIDHVSSAVDLRYIEDTAIESFGNSAPNSWGGFLSTIFSRRQTSVNSGRKRPATLTCKHTHNVRYKTHGIRCTVLWWSCQFMKRAPKDGTTWPMRSAALVSLCIILSNLHTIIWPTPPDALLPTSSNLVQLASTKGPSCCRRVIEV